MTENPVAARLRSTDREASAEIDRKVNDISAASQADADHLETRIAVLEHMLHLHAGLDLEDVDAVVANVAAARDRLAKAFTDDEAEAWLTSPQRELDGKRPMDLILTGGHARVTAALNDLRLPE